MMTALLTGLVGGQMTRAKIELDGSCALAAQMSRQSTLHSRASEVIKVSRNVLGLMALAAGMGQT